MAGAHASISSPLSAIKITHQSVRRLRSLQFYRAATDTFRSRVSGSEMNHRDSPELSESELNTQDLFEPEDYDLAWPDTSSPSFSARAMKSLPVPSMTAQASKMQAHRRALWATRKRRERGKLGKRRKRIAIQLDVRPKKLILKLRTTGDVGDMDRTLALDEYSTVWAREIARLSAKYDRQLSRPLMPRSRGRLRAHVSVSVSAPISGGTFNDHRSQWMRLSSTARAFRWPHVMLWCLEEAPAEALDMLLATNTHPLPPGYQVADALDLIACFMTRRTNQSGTKSLPQLFKGLCSILHAHESPPPVTQRTMRILLMHSTLTEASSLYELLESHGVNIHTNTTLQFANAFIDNGRRDLAMELLSTAVKHGADVTALAFQKTCGKLLRGPRHAPVTCRESSTLIQGLFRLDVQLNIVMYNILIMNAVDANDFGTAWEIYDMMQEYDMRSDSYTYSILLRATRLTSDHFTWRKLYDQIRSDRISGLLQLSPVLVTELLWSFYYFGSLTNFQDVLDEYTKHCDLQPLQNLGMVSEDYDPGYVTGPRPLPCTATLVVMIFVYIRRSQRISPAAVVYQNLRRLLKEEDPCIVPLIASTYTLNIFLKAFARTKGSINLWPVIMRDMTTPLSAHVINRDTKQPLKPCKPTAQSWNILVNAFMRRKQFAAAEKTVELMKAQNMKPDIVTWNTLIGDYARMHYVEGVVKVLKTMETEGLTIDRYTIEGLQHVQDQSRLMDGLNKLHSEKVLDADGGQAERADGKTDARVGGSIMDSADQTEGFWAIEDLFEDEDEDDFIDE